MRSLTLALTIFISACAGTPKTVAPGPQNPCLGVSAPGDYETHADWEAIFVAVEPDLDPRDACYDDAGEEVDCVYEMMLDFIPSGTQGDHHLIIEAEGGYRLYRQLVTAPSGGFCGWEPISRQTSAGPFTVVSASAEHFFYEQNTCQPMGHFAYFAILDSMSLDLIATFSCEAASEPKLSLRGDRLHIDGCNQGAVSFNRAELSACKVR